MDSFTTIRRIIDALVTGLAVVFGLMPDPTRVPVEYDPPRDR